MIEDAQSRGRALDIDNAAARVRLLPILVSLDHPLADLARLAPPGHPLGHPDVPMPHLATTCVADQVTCGGCDWAGYFDLFPEHSEGRAGT